MPNADSRSGPARLRLMGGFRLSGPDGAAVTITSRRACGLLAYLAMSPDRTATRERLSGLLWSDRGEAQARASLRQTLLDLRGVLSTAGLDVLDFGRDRIAMKVGGLDSDVADLERVAAGGDPLHLARSLNELGGGRFLEDGEIGGLFGEWLHQTRARLDQWLASIALARLERLCADSHWGPARALADAYLRRDPLDEGVTALAIRADGAMGEISAARRRYQSLRDALAKDLGVEPGGAVRDALNAAERLTLPPAAVQPALHPAPLALPSKPSIAILPFANLTGDPGQDYLADGVVEEIVSALSRFKSLFVIASSSTHAFRGGAVGAKAVSARLGVRYVLQGSIRQAGGRVRIAVKLSDGTDESQIWADRFDDTLLDIFALEDRIALSVAGVIEPTIQGAEIQRAAARHSDNPGSYELYLRATPLAQTLGREEVLQAIDMLDRALALDPHYGLALSLAALCHSSVAAYGLASDAAFHGQACRDMAERALRVAGDNPEVLARVASALAGIGENLDGALAMIDRSIALNPGSAYGWFVSGRLRVMAGQSDLAVEHMETSMRLDPLSHFRRAHQLSNLALARFQQGRFDETVALFRASLQLLPNVPVAHAVVASALGHLGQADAAREALARYHEMTAASVDGWLGFFRDPAHRRLFHDGIAMIKTPRPLRIVASG